MAGAFGKLVTGCLLAAWLIAGGAVCAQPVLHQPRASPALPPARVAPAASAIVENGRECTVITFEGVGNLAAIPVFDGISSPGWLGVIDADAGGTGNFAQEPSPETIAFWLGGDPSVRDIVMSNPASKVEFFYTSYVGVTLQALDDTGAVLATAVGPPNHSGGSGDPTGDFNHWDPLRVETDGNRIKTVRVSGNSNQTGIDNLKVCTTIGVEAAEMTQAIQQYQDLDALKASLAATREPPVPLVAGKPGVLRLYMRKVTAVTDVAVRLSGAASGTLTMPLQPHCTVEDQRRQRNGCRAFDFYLIPPAGAWDLKAEVLDSRGTVLETHDFPFRSRATETLTLKAVSVCDERDAAGVWQCAPASKLGGLVGVLRKIAPTASVRVALSGHEIRRATAGYPITDNWWGAVAREANDLLGFFEGWASDHRVYYGMVRKVPEVPGGLDGRAHGIPSHAALSRVTAMAFGVDLASETVAHEVGHTLGLRHTNRADPATAAPPGCYALAGSAAPDWPYPDNRIQSRARLEVGFDVVAHKPLQPEVTFDIMSYCTPRWISPNRYKLALTGLGGGAVTTTSVAPDDVPPAPRAALTGDFWTVSGVLADGAAVLDPVFRETTTGPDDAGNGEYRIDVEDAGGAVLYTRHFTPTVGDPDSDDAAAAPAFFELIPARAGAAAIVVVDPAGVRLGTVALAGATPAVRIVQPAGGGTRTGRQTIAWEVTDPDSAAFAAKVYYSAGAGWVRLARVEGANSVEVDTDALPGGLAARVKVVVSDGANTGSAVSEPFAVPRKTLRDVRILAPAPGTAYPRAALVQFEGTAFDVDDGLLDDGAIAWHSSIDGALGEGAVLSTTALRPGTHEIAMTATDSDGNRATATTTVRVAGAPPTLALTVTPLDTLPTTCVEASIVVRPDPGGVGLASAEYSLDGGLTWTRIPLAKLPYKFIVPGSGFIHFVARVFDQAVQLAAQDAKFFADSACFVAGSPRIDGRVAAQGSAGPGVLFVDVVLRNGGQGLARAVRLDSVVPRTLAGTGTVTLDATRSPPLPLALPDLNPGASHTVRLYFNVPATVRRFALVESGGLADVFGRTLRFSINQAVTP